MKKIISLTIIFILLLTLILSSCVDNTATTSNASDLSNTAEDSSFEESSEVASNSSAETEAVSAATSEIDDSSLPSENSVGDESSNAETITNENFVPHYFYNENAEEAFLNHKTHDYCTCGAIQYEWKYQYPTHIEMVADNFYGFFEEKGYFTRDELRAFFTVEGEKIKENSLYTKAGWTELPGLYKMIKHFNITKEDYLEFREEEYERYKKSDIYDYFFTEREVEILFGNYSDETVMKELKSANSYYYEGALYTEHSLTYYADDELLKELLKEESFQLYVFDMENLGIGIKLAERIAKLQAEEAETAE